MNAKEILSRRGYMLRLTLPIFITYLLNIAVNTVDQMMVSNYSQTAVAAIGNANQISSLLSMFFTVLNVASVILISQFKGAEDEKGTKSIYTLSILCNVVASVAVAAVSLTLGEPIFRAMQVQEGAVLEGAVTYLRITGGAIIFQALVMAYTSFMKSNSMMTWPLIVSVGINAVNILVNWLLIYGVGPFPEMGVAGAAIGTAVSRAMGTVSMIIIFRVKMGRLDWKALRPFPWKRLGHMLKIGAPSAGETISYNISQLVVMVMINTMGLVSVNSKIYVQSVVVFAYLFSFALAEATMVVTGYLLGDKRHDDAHRRVMRSLLTAIVVAVGLAVVIWLLRDQVVGLFMASSTDADIETLRREILQMCGTLLFIDIFLEFGRATNLVMVRALQAAGDVMFPVLANVVSSWVICVGLGYVLGIVLQLGLPGIWLALMADEILRGIVMIIRWKKGGWRKIDLIKETSEE